ncbi:chorismate mutase [Paenibacillus sacheonensis]|uniref:Chorismate mutase n=1 Tax=Paenibacillus sacheonensis TaxID=742054 RepID=A0A7X4YPB5_9BACL|nr:chorismate mutase [Paenibacillus sacheonensis]MBM7565222.1 chorismate mutase [Paenibacillus sacheonensis]NBC70002.1 chorismate mutase [Paenibacillus sacheonensis]
MADLAELRANIDDIDRQLVSLLARRFQCTEEVGKYKERQGLPAQDAVREAQQFQKIEAYARQHGLNTDYAEAIFRHIMDLVIARHIELRAVNK